MKVYLANQFDFNFCGTLGHENTSKYLLNYAPKVEIRDQLILLLSSQRREEIPFTRVKRTTDCHLVFGDITCATCIIMV